MKLTRSEVRSVYTGLSYSIYGMSPSLLSPENVFELLGRVESLLDSSDFYIEFEKEIEYGNYQS